MAPIANENVGRGLFVVDFYHKTYNDGPVTDAAAMVAARDQGLIGAIPKCSDGGNGHAWYRNHAYPELRAAAGDRYGRDWLVGGYHFLRWDEAGGTGAHQADVFIWNHEHAKGWRGWDDHGLILPCLDIEGIGEVDEFGNPKRNYNATKAEVLDHASAFIARIKQVTGRRTIVYGRSFYSAVTPRITWAELERAGAAGGWNAAYTVTEDTHQLPMPREKAWLWQYTNGKTNKTPFPTRFRGVNHELDICVFKGSKAGGAEMLRVDKARQYLCGQPSPAVQCLKVAAAGAVLVGASAFL